MEIRKISWKGVFFPLVKVIIFANTPDERLVYVSSTRLEKLLINAVLRGDKDALKLDERLGYYIRESDFDITEDDLINEIEQVYALQK